MRKVAIDRGMKTLNAYTEEEEGVGMVTIQEALTDLLADLKQAAAANGADWEEALRLADLHAETEMAEDYDEENPL